MNMSGKTAFGNGHVNTVGNTCEQTLLILNVVLLFRHLAGEVAKEWQEVEESDKAQQETLLKLVKEIVPYNMAHNAEHEACDLLMEIERLDMLEDYIDENAYGKVCLYLTR